MDFNYLNYDISDFVNPSYDISIEIVFEGIIEYNNIYMTSSPDVQDLILPMYIEFIKSLISRLNDLKTNTHVSADNIDAYDNSPIHDYSTEDDFGKMLETSLMYYKKYKESNCPIVRRLLLSDSIRHLKTIRNNLSDRLFSLNLTNL